MRVNNDTFAVFALMLCSKFNILNYKAKSIGVLGGSFDPPHVGHLHISLAALKYLHVNKVVWLITPQNPFKTTNIKPTLNQRITLALQITHQYRNFIQISSIEQHLEQQGKCYTINAIKRIALMYSNTNIIWLMGTDNLHSIHTWEHSNQFLRYVTVAAFERIPHNHNIQDYKFVIKSNSPMIDYDNRMSTSLCPNDNRLPVNFSTDSMQFKRVNLLKGFEHKKQVAAEVELCKKSNNVSEDLKAKSMRKMLSEVELRKRFGEKIIVLKIKPLNISSTQIRAMKK